MTLWHSFSPAAGRLEGTKDTCVLTGLSVASGAAAESLQLGPVNQRKSGSAEVAMIEMDGPVVVGSIGEYPLHLPESEGIVRWSGYF
jgi:hypothetical protein